MNIRELGTVPKVEIPRAQEMKCRIVWNCVELPILLIP